MRDNPRVGKNINEIAFQALVLVFVTKRTVRRCRLLESAAWGLHIHTNTKTKVKEQWRRTVAENSGEEQFMNTQAWCLCLAF